MRGTGDLGVGESEGEKDGVAGGHVGDGDLVGGFSVAVFGDGQVASEGGASELAQIDAHGTVFLRAELLGNFGGGLNFDAVALAVVEGKAVA